MSAYQETLELRLGPPRWYAAAVSLLFALIIMSLVIEPLKWPYTALVVILAFIATVRDCSKRHDQRQFSRLRIYPNRTAVLVLRDGREITAKLGNGFWISRPLIVVCVECDDKRNRRVLVARGRNRQDEYRRFGVLCRYGFAEPDG